MRADARIHRTALMVGISVLLTIGFAGGLLWLFFYRVIFPLRGMMADAQLFRGGRCDTGKESNEDELHAMGHYLRDLMSDVTDTRSRLERSRNRLLNAEKLASVGKIAASVAHEIRNPLTAMKMWLFSIQEAAEGNADLLGKLAIVSEEIARLEGIVRNFLEFSRPPVIQCQSQDVNLVIDGTLELLGPRLQQAKIAITRASPPGLPAAMADAKQLKQVFINLLGNAADAMCHGGNVDITATVEKDADGRSMVVVRVCDTGSGMPQDVQKRIFEPFFTTKDTGRGWGCVSPPKSWLGMVARSCWNRRQNRAPALRFGCPLSKKVPMAKILVVDDERRVRRAFENILAGKGYLVVAVRTAEDALGRLEDEAYDLVLLDIQLPGMNGLDALARIKQLRVTLPVIVMTGQGTMDTAIEATKRGAFDYQLKPFEPAEMLRTIAKALEAARLMSGHLALGPATAAPSTEAMIGQSAVMQQVYKAIGRVARTDATVLIRGESGTGKELVARAIYQHSVRSRMPMMVVNCAAIPETLLESELFGYEPGPLPAPLTAHRKVPTGRRRYHVP